MSAVAKLDYLRELAWKRLRGEGLVCPSCGASGYEVCDRKFVLAELRRCAGCSLLYRAPTDTPEQNQQFYQVDYTEGFTTDLPDEATLRKLIETRFAGTEKSYAEYIRVLTALGAAPGCRLYDYGCSWGYGSWQFAQAGYQVRAFEISRPRGEFARQRLGVDCTQVLPTAATVGDQTHTFDVFFSAHVLEHVPSPAAVIDLARALLKPGGLFVAFTPNGSAEHRAVDPAGWHTTWGKVHPNMLDEQYYRVVFAGRRILFDSSPADQQRLEAFAAGREVPATALTRSELLCAVRL